MSKITAYYGTRGYGKEFFYKTNMKKYLVVINYCEEETHLFDSKEEMLKYFKVNSIEELLNKSSWLSEYTVYEISCIYRS